MTLTDEEVARRKPVWSALSELWLDTELQDDDLSRIAEIMDESGYSLAQLRRIYLFDVAPVVYRNLLCVAGEWAGFDRAWLHAAIVESLDRRDRLSRHRRQRIRRRLRRWPRPLARLALRLWRYRAAGRRRDYLMTYATEGHWNVLARKVEARRQR